MGLTFSVGPFGVVRKLRFFSRFTLGVRNLEGHNLKTVLVQVTVIGRHQSNTVSIKYNTTLQMSLTLSKTCNLSPSPRLTDTV